MAIIVNGDGILTGVSSLATALTDLTSGRGTVTGVATVGTLQLGAGVSMSSPRTQNAAIFTNNTEFLTVDDAGRVGVGTISPNTDAHPENEKKINVGFITARSIAGDIDANTLVVAGISTFVGALNATSVVSSGAISGTSGSFTGDLSIPDILAHQGDGDTRIRFPANDTISAETGGTEALRVDSGQRLLLGSTSSQEVYGAVKLQIQGTTGTTSSMSLLRHGNSPYMILGSSGGSSLGAVTALSDGDRIGQFTFVGADGTDVNTHAASMAAYVNGSVSSNTVPADIAFQFGTSETQKVRITSAGNIDLKAANAHFKSESSSSGDWVRMYAGAGTGKWDIYGNGANLRFSDNDAAGNVAFDRPVIVGSTVVDHTLGVLAANSTTPAFGIQNPSNDENINFSTYHDSSGIYLGIGANAKFDANGNFAVDTTAHRSAILSIDGRNHGRFTFACGDSGGTPSTVATIDRFGNLTLADGDLNFGTNGHGIGFSQTGAGGGMTSELLDDYEEGTWTPVYVSSNSTISYTTQQGFYTKVGDLVHVTAYIRTSAVSSSSHSLVKVSGLPFAEGNAQRTPGAVRCNGFQGTGFDTFPVTWSVEASQTFGELQKFTNGGNNDFTTSTMNDATFVYLQCTYHTAS